MARPRPVRAAAQRAHLPAHRGAIAARIFARSLRPGEPLPPELDLAAQFGVKRATVREALRELESHGLSRAAGTKRLVVSRPSGAHSPTRVSQALALHDVTVARSGRR